MTGLRLIDVSAAYVPLENPRERSLLIRALVERTETQQSADSARALVRRHLMRDLRALPDSGPINIEVSTIP